MGTRFCATQEAPIHDNFKQQMVANDERATDLIFRTLHNTARAWPGTPSASRWSPSSGAARAKFEDVADLVEERRGREGLINGDADHGVWSAGMVQGLIHDVPTVNQLIDGIVSEAEDLIRGRLAGWWGRG